MSRLLRSIFRTETDPALPIQSGQSSRNPVRLMCFALPLLSLLAGCGGNSSSGSSATQSSAVAIPIPVQIIQLRAVDQSQLLVVVSVDDKVVDVQSNDDNTQWSSRFTIPEDRQADLIVLWSLDGLLLARHQQKVGPANQQNSLALSSDIYVTSGSDFDFDSDGISNLKELQDGTDPRRNEGDTATPGSDEVDVIIPRVINGPSVNGQVGVIWESNPLVDTRGQALAIDNLMIDRGAVLADGATGFRWQAVHDGTTLYVLVYAEADGNQTPNGDSRDLSDDDTLNLYFDGDNSKGPEYDGSDDRHLFIPLMKLLGPQDASLNATSVLDDDGNLRRTEDGDLVVDVDGVQMVVTAGTNEANENVNSTGRIAVATNSASLPPSLKFSNCLCAGSQQLYEISVSLEELGITVGEPFGLELQLDDDVDGGDQDARYGWKHPSRVDATQVNNTASNPSFMGTAILAK